MEKNQFSFQSDAGKIDINIESEDRLTSETFDELISGLKVKFAESLPSKAQVEKEDTKILEKNVHKMSQKEYELWRSAMDRRKRGEAQK